MVFQGPLLPGPGVAGLPWTRGLRAVTENRRRRALGTAEIAGRILARIAAASVDVPRAGDSNGPARDSRGGDHGNRRRSTNADRRRVPQCRWANHLSDDRLHVAGLTGYVN